MDKLLSSNPKTDEGDKDEEEDVANDSSKGADEEIENEENNAVENENKELDENQTVKNGDDDAEKIDTENQPISSTDDKLDAVTVDAVEDNESLDDVNEGANDKDRENEKDAAVQETEANEVDADAEAGGMLRAAIDGLPVDLECVKDETEINALEKQVESDSKPEQCEEKNITESAITSNQGTVK